MDGRVPLEGRSPSVAKQGELLRTDPQGGARIEFEREVKRRKDEGILRSWEGEETNSMLPLIAVVRPTKNVVSPLLDFRELNEHLSCCTDS